MRGILIILVLGFALQGAGQEESNEKEIRKNTVFAELGGSGVLYSLNYDRILLHSNRHRVSGRIGVAYYGVSRVSSLVAVPIELNFLLGKDRHFFNIGIAYTPTFGDRFYIVDEGSPSHPQSTSEDYYYDYYTVPRIGYRFQSDASGLYFGAAFTPLFFTEKEQRSSSWGSVMPWAAIQIGYSF